MRRKFLRRNWRDYSRLGRKRKKLQKWRAPKGRHNKMRERRAGYPRVVSIGYGNKSNERGKVNGLIPKRISNIKELLSIKKGEVAVMAAVGKKKKVELVQKAKEKGIIILNLSKPSLRNLEFKKNKKEQK